MKLLKKLLKFTKYYQDKKLFNKTFVFIPDEKGTVIFKDKRYRIEEKK